MLFFVLQVYSIVKENASFECLASISLIDTIIHYSNYYKFGTYTCGTILCKFKIVSTKFGVL